MLDTEVAPDRLVLQLDPPILRAVVFEPPQLGIRVDRLGGQGAKQPGVEVEIGPSTGRRELRRSARAA